MKTLSLNYDPTRTVCSVELPLSKSVALRAMTINAMVAACGVRGAVIPRLPDAADVAGMCRALIYYYRELRKINRDVRIPDYIVSPEEYLRPQLVEINMDDPTSVNIGEGGAPLRFFLALAASTPGVTIKLDCESSLKKRPHALLVQKLRELGADIVSTDDESTDRPPYTITGKCLRGGTIEIDAGVSSQYISALMMAAPLWDKGMALVLKGDRIVSRPYIEMTKSLLESFGVKVSIRDNVIEVASYKACNLNTPTAIRIPSDWSAASYLYELRLIAPVRLNVTNLTPAQESLQGDSDIQQMCSRLGILTCRRRDESFIITNRERSLYPESVRWNLKDTPDLVPALAVGLCLAGVKFRFAGVAHLRHKETDRLVALQRELLKLGYLITVAEDTLLWDGVRTSSQSCPVISTYNDHRMAMAFAPAAIRYPGLMIENPDVVNKSFPRYWEMLSELGFGIGIVDQVIEIL